MSNFDDELVTYTYLMDLAAAIFNGLMTKDYEPGATNYISRENALRIVAHDPVKDKSYSIVIKELKRSETDTKIENI